MAEIKSIDEIAKKWAEVTPQRSGDYAAGLKNPRRPWAASTKAAEDAWGAGVQRAVQLRTFAKGVIEAGDEKWYRKASVEGVARWGPGVAGAQGEYAKGFAPYVDAIRNCKLPPRYARRDPRNIARVTAIISCLVAKKESLSSK